MRAFKLSKGKIKNIDGKEIEQDYHKSLVNLLKFPPSPQEAFSLEIVEKRLAIIKKLKETKPNEEVLLEEDEWQELMKAIDKAKWSVVEQYILDLAKCVKEAKTVKVGRKE